MNLLNFNEAVEIAPEYAGSEKKKTMILKDKQYLVKFPDPNRSNKLEISYINNVYSEYIGTKIFELCGFKTQKVVLGTYSKDGKDRIVCGCEDFTKSDTKLIEFEKFENASIEPNPYKRELKDIFHILESGIYNVNLDEVNKKFWNMFIIDCLIGNIDRHNGNWGFLKNVKEEKLTFSPIYDCGSCLFSTYTDEKMSECLNNETKMFDCIKNTSSAIKDDGAKIKYSDFIISMKNEECNNAILRMYNRIELDKIFKLIDDINVISNIRKQFYKTVIERKYKDILTVAYKKLNKIDKK